MERGGLDAGSRPSVAPVSSSLPPQHQSRMPNASVAAVGGRGPSYAHLLAALDAEWAFYLENRSPLSKIQNFRVADIWRRFQPAWACPSLDRLGPLSEGGKWVCGVEAMALQAAAPGPSGCNIYSFGVSGDVQFEQALMKELEAVAPGACRLRLFDPYVRGLPPTQPITGNHTFEPIGLGETTGNHSCGALPCRNIRDIWPQFTLVDLLKRDGVAKADLLKVDVEGAEYGSLVDALCRELPPDQPLPFDQLLIEIHRPRSEPRAYVLELLTCLENRGFVAFSREPNLHDCACSGNSMWCVEFAFVRRNSVFTSELAAKAHLRHQGRQGHQGGVVWSDILARQEVLYQKAVHRREAHVRHTYEQTPRGGKAKVAGSWSDVLPWRCSRGPVYLWDVFEPRFPCPMRRFHGLRELAPPEAFGEPRLSCLRAPSQTTRRQLSSSSSKSVKAKHSAPKVEYRELATRNQWETLRKDCASGALSHHDEINVRMDLSCLVTEPGKAGDLIAFGSTKGEHGPAATLSTVVSCLEGEGFRIYGNEIEAEHCETTKGRNANSPRVAWLGFVRRDSQWLVGLLPVLAAY